MNDAEKREKVIRGLVRFIDDFKPFCGNRADWQKVYDALALLKEQEPRVMMLEEIRSGAVEVVWLEDADKPNVIPGIWFRLSNEGGDEAVDIHVMDGFFGARLAVYGKLWRCWTSRPSPEQMRGTKWEGESDAE